MWPSLTLAVALRYHVSLAFRHAVALGVVTPLSGDVCGDADFCLGRIRMHEAAKQFRPSYQRASEDARAYLEARGKRGGK